MLVLWAGVVCDSDVVAGRSCDGFEEGKSAYGTPSPPPFTPVFFCYRVRWAQAVFVVLLRALCAKRFSQLLWGGGGLPLVIPRVHGRTSGDRVDRLRSPPRGIRRFFFNLLGLR